MVCKNNQLVQLKPASITICNVQEIQTLFLNALNEYQKIELDLSIVNDIDCAGVQLIIALKKSAAQQQKEVTLSAYSREVMAFLTLLNMATFFD